MATRQTRESKLAQEQLTKEPAKTHAGGPETIEQLSARISETLSKLPLDDVNEVIAIVVKVAGQRLVNDVQNVEKEHERISFAKKQFLSLFEKQ